VSARDVVWNEVLKVGVCLDCLHAECLEIADVAEKLVRLLETAK
jgi:hypothetical protein